MSPGRTDGIEVPLPGAAPVLLRHAVFDFNGTLATDGALVPGVAARLRRLAKLLPITVLTADTFGTSRAALRGLPVSVHIIDSGRDKARFVRRWARAGVAAVGNGNNDVPMLRAATVGIVVLGREGLSSPALRAASILVATVGDAIDLLLRAKRLLATLRR